MNSEAYVCVEGPSMSLLPLCGVGETAPVRPDDSAELLLKMPESQRTMHKRWMGRFGRC